MSTFNTVRDLLVDQFKLDPAQITPDAALDSLAIDSLSAAEFMFLLEDEFKVDAPAESTNIHTVQDMVEAIDRLVAEKQLAEKQLAKKQAAGGTPEDMA